MFYGYLVNVEFGSSDYSIQESADHVEVCLTLDGMAVFPISFRISAGETSPRDAEGESYYVAEAWWVSERVGGWVREWVSIGEEWVSEWAKEWFGGWVSEYENR